MKKSLFALLFMLAFCVFFTGCASGDSKTLNIADDNKEVERDTPNQELSAWQQISTSFAADLRRPQTPPIY